MRGPLEEFFDYTFRSVEPRSLAGPGAQDRPISAAGSFPRRRSSGTPPLAPFAGLPRGGDQPLTNFLRRGFMVLPYQHPVERLYAGVGMRMNAQHTNPDFLATAFSIPDRLKIHGRTQKYILRKACEGLLSPSMLATGKSFNRLKHDTQMCEVLDRLADDCWPRARSAARGLFEPGYVARLRRRPPGRPYSQERAYRLWSLLLTEFWARRFLDQRGAPPEHPLPPMRHLSPTR